MPQHLFFFLYELPPSSTIQLEASMVNTVNRSSEDLKFAFIDRSNLAMFCLPVG
jgi:hypothetical protein